MNGIDEAQLRILITQRIDDLATDLMQANNLQQRDMHHADSERLQRAIDDIVVTFSHWIMDQ
jgi:hypothetical protein